MAGSLKTAFFNLVKYAATDITSWLTDFNGNMDKIDTAMNQNKTAAQTAQDGVDNLEAEYESLLTVVNSHTTSIDANEKAIAANSASIEELENEVNAIKVGNYFRYDLNNISKIENLISALEMFIVRVGNMVKVNGGLTFQSGTCHVYDRQVSGGVLNGRYVTDLYRITGNPLNLENNVYYPFSITTNSTELNGYRTLTVAYLPESAYTVIGIATLTSEAVSFSAQSPYTFV